MDLISHKMKAAGFATHFIGKGHLSYLTTDHMPINRAFDSHVGYLNAMEEYQHGLDTGCFWKECPWEHTCNLDFWDDHGPASAELLAGLHYSTNWYANRAISKIQQHPKDQGLYIHLTWYAQQHLPVCLINAAVLSLKRRSCTTTGRQRTALTPPRAPRCRRASRRYRSTTAAGPPAQTCRPRFIPAS